RAHFPEVVELACRQHLREMHHDELLARIDPVRGVIRAAPSELAHRPRLAARTFIGHDRETEPEADAVAKRHTAQVIARHELNRLAAEVSFAVELTAVQ